MEPAKSFQLCLTLCNQWTIAHQPPLSMGILQARKPEWVAMPSSRGSSQPRDGTQVFRIAGRFFTESPGKPKKVFIISFSVKVKVAQSCLTLCNSMGCSMPGLPVLHQHPELAQTHIHLVSDAIQPSHPLLSPSPAFNLSQHQGLF